MKGELRWERQGSGAWYAYSGRVIVGMCGERYDGLFFYSVDAVRTRPVSKGHGQVTTMAGAKRAVNRAWSAWLDAADLVPPPPKDPQT